MDRLKVYTTVEEAGYLGLCRELSPDGWGRCYIYTHIDLYRIAARACGMRMYYPVHRDMLFTAVKR